jgi:DNA invertase Pin-like site-specific DNA recombinase
MLEIFKHISRNERKMIKERQRQRIEIAKMKGVYKGLKPKYRVDSPNSKDRLIDETVIKKLEEEKRVFEIVENRN